MNNPIQQAHAAMIARLGEITPGNGYQTDAGTRIKEGWLAELMNQEDLGYPFIAIQPDEYPPPKGDAGSLHAIIGRRVVGVVNANHPDGYREALDALWLDIARALIVQPALPNPWGRTGPYKVTFGSSNLFPPDSGLAAGTVLFPVQLHIIINGE